MVHHNSMTTQVQSISSPFSEKTIEAGWLAAAVLVPLAFNPWGLSSFALPKAVVLVAIVFLMILSCLVVGFERRKPACPTANAVDRAAIVFALVLLFSTVLSVNPRLSLMGSFEREQGLLVRLCYVFLFLSVSFKLHSRRQADRLVSALVLGSAPVVLYGLIQLFSLDPAEWHTDAPSRVFSTLGRGNFLGSYLVLLIPLTLFRMLSWGKGFSSNKSRATGYSLLFIGQMLCLITTLARGAWIGFMAAIVVYALGRAALFGNRRLAAGILASAILLAAVVFFLGLPISSMEPIKELPGLERLASLTKLDEGSTAARLTVWHYTLPLVLKRPWLGYGIETMYEVFVHIFPPQLVYYQGRHVTVDRAHNLWLDLAMTSGILGVGSFLALLICFARLSWKKLKSALDSRQKHLCIAISAAIIGHLVDQQFSFSLAGIGVVFWLLLGLGTALGRGLNPHQESHRDQETGPPSLTNTLSFSIFYIIMFFLFCLRPILADTLAWYSRNGNAPIDQRIINAQDAVWLEPGQPAYRHQLSWMYLQAGNPALAEKELLAAERLSPDDPRVYSAKGELYGLWGRENQKQFKKAERAYRRALDLAPHTASFHTALGLVLALQGRFQEGIAALERAVELDATDGVAFSHLADLYDRVGRLEEARRAREKAKHWDGFED